MKIVLAQIIVPIKVLNLPFALPVLKQKKVFLVEFVEVKDV